MAGEVTRSARIRNVMSESLEGKVALVTGAARRVGRGPLARELPTCVATPAQRAGRGASASGRLTCTAPCHGALVGFAPGATKSKVCRQTLPG